MPGEIRFLVRQPGFHPAIPRLQQEGGLFFPRKSSQKQKPENMAAELLSAKLREEMEESRSRSLQRWRGKQWYQLQKWQKRVNIK